MRQTNKLKTKTKQQILAWWAEGKTMGQIAKLCQLNKEDLFAEFACTRSAVSGVISRAGRQRGRRR